MAEVLYLKNHWKQKHKYQRDRAYTAHLANQGQGQLPAWWFLHVRRTNLVALVYRGLLLPGCSCTHRGHWLPLHAQRAAPPWMLMHAQKTLVALACTEDDSSLAALACTESHFCLVAHAYTEDIEEREVAHQAACQRQAEADTEAALQKEAVARLRKEAAAAAQSEQMDGSTERNLQEAGGTPTGRGTAAIGEERGSQLEEDEAS
eukprot:98195-Pelagomonas_calceolata.AAC.2